MVRQQGVEARHGYRTAQDTNVFAGRFDKGSAIAGLKGSDNIISFYTKRYGERALIIQGAG